MFFSVEAGDVQVASSPLATHNFCFIVKYGLNFLKM